ncbi:MULTISPECIES: hypothetical protein [unclassified Bradyrhizobium]|jgi:hypothetical protein|uniref:hypothetical protein n=1 Tax=unclassified Bradyrhizobium TaxID=2631580 RepID=UPI001FF71948|nr:MULTISPECIES: hypothetical protein [unclassified Bradyrhizobium]MCK1522592.1 hypothetical protein [Bradyrhizobium sp. 17]MCK1686030.1 hypothetical protein [Bradyrhizobium sp. 145]
MTLYTVASRQGTRSGVTTLAGPLFLLAVAVILSAISRRAVTHLARWSDIYALVLVCLAFAGALAFNSIRYRDFSPPLRITAVAIGMAIFVQLLFDSLGPFAGPPNILFGSSDKTLFFRYGAVLAVVAGIAAVWRPSFLLPLFYFYHAWREMVSVVSGIFVTETDYLGMLDIGNFVVLGVLGTIVLTSAPVIDRVPRLRTLFASTDNVKQLRDRTYGLIWACAVGAHLGSYFWSGISKLQAGGEKPWTWLLANPTQTSILMGLERGDAPLGLWPGALQTIWDAIASNQLIFNVFVLGAQLLSPLAAISTRALSFFCLLFDIFHIGVYFTLGALFFFWIALNLFIVAAARMLPRDGFTPVMKVVMVVTVICGRLFFYTNYLGWLDGPKLASPRLFVETRDGRQILAPSTYFGIYSYMIGTGTMYIPENHFRARVGGNNHDLATWHDATDCGPEILARQDTGVAMEAVEKLVRETDRFFRVHPWVKDNNSFYAYPHHMLSNPWLYGEFNKLTMDDIVAYHYVVDSVCLGLVEGKLVRDVRKRTDYRIAP